MKAAIVRAPGATPELAEFAEPAVSDGRTGVELVAAGVHRLVQARASGAHYSGGTTWPQILGVDAVARGADGTLMYTGFVEPPYGTIAERMAVPAGMRAILPAGADPVAVAAGVNPGLASWVPLTARRAETGGVGTVLVLGVTGVSGYLAVQNALALGAARVVGAGRNREFLARAGAAGADTVPLSGDGEQDAAALAAALGGAAPNLILDFVWGRPAEALFAALARHGEDDDPSDIAYVQIGSMAGPDASVPASLLRSRRFRLTGHGIGSTPRAASLAQLPVFIRRIADGLVDVPTLTFPMSQIAEAWAAARGGPRVVVVPG